MRRGKNAAQGQSAVEKLETLMSFGPAAPPLWMEGQRGTYDFPGDTSAATPIVDRANVVLERDRARREQDAAEPAYQREGLAVGAGYLNNPLDEQGRQRIVNQFWEAPLGGWVRRGAEGLGADAELAAIAERTAAGLLATGIGVPAFLAAVDALNGTEQTAGTIPLQPVVY